MPPLTAVVQDQLKSRYPGEVIPPKCGCRAPQADGPFPQVSLFLQRLSQPGLGAWSSPHLVGWGWDGPGTCQKCFGFGTMELHQLLSLPPSLPPSTLPQSVPQLLSFPHWSLMFCHRLPVGAGSRKWSCHSRRLSLLMFQLVSHKEMVKHNPLRAAGSWIEFFHLSPETALYSHTDKTNGLAGSDSDRAASGVSPTRAVSP